MTVLTIENGHFQSDPGVTRTPDKQFRKLLLYPPELRGHRRQAPRLVFYQAHEGSGPDWLSAPGKEKARLVGGLPVLIGVDRGA